ncbi:MAG: hypothetical protein WDN04_24915 [Rhodospirillales bacterium]
MDKLAAGSCTKYHADAPADYFKRIRFWKTPGAPVRQWRKQLPGLQRLAAGLAAGQGMTAQLAALRTFAGRRPWLTTAAMLALPASWFVVFYLAALVSLFISASGKSIR